MTDIVKLGAFLVTHEGELQEMQEMPHQEKWPNSIMIFDGFKQVRRDGHVIIIEPGFSAIVYAADHELDSARKAVRQLFKDRKMNYFSTDDARERGLVRE